MSQVAQESFSHQGVQTSRNEIIHTFTINTSNYRTISNIHFTDNPIEIHGDTITIHGESIQKGRYYDFVYEGKKYLLYRPSRDITEIYKIK